MLSRDLAKLIVAQRRACFIAGMILTVLCIAGLTLAGIRNDYREFFDTDNGYLEVSDWLQERQGEGSDIALLIYRPGSGNVVDPISTSQLLSLTQFLGGVDGVLGAESWLDATRLVLVDDGERVRPIATDVLAELDLFSADGTARLQARIGDMPNIHRRLIAEDFDSALVRIFLDFNSADPDREAKLIHLQAEVAAAEALLQETRSEDSLSLVGASMFDQAAQHVLREDLRLLFPLALILVVGVLWYFFRSPRFIGLGLVIVILPVIATAGLVAAMGFKFSTLAVSGLLLVGTLAVADVVHLANGFFVRQAQGLERSEAVEGTLAQNMWPIFVTTLTTAIGQIAMLMSASPPIQVMGIVILTGVWLALIIAMLVLPVLLMSCERRSLPKLLGLSEVLVRLSMWSLRNSRPVLLIAALIACLACVSISQNRLGDSLGGWFSERTEFRQGMDILSHDYTGSGAITVALEVPRDDLLAARRFPASSEATDRYAKIQTKLDEAPISGDWYSVPVLVRDLEKQVAQNPSIKLSERPPDAKVFSPEHVAQSGLFTRLALGSKDYSIWQFEPESDSSFTMEADALKVVTIFDQNADERTVRIGGLGLAFAALSVTNFWGILMGSLLALGLITLTMTALMKSLRLGVLTLAPNFAPILAALGTWCLLHDQINMAAITVFSVAMGLVVDDTVHLLTKFRGYRLSGQSTTQAIEASIRATGTALLATTLVISGGFLLLGLSGFLLTAQKAGLVGFTVALALLFDLTVLPALLRVIYPDKMDPEQRGSHEDLNREGLS